LSWRAKGAIECLTVFKPLLDKAKRKETL